MKLKSVKVHWFEKMGTINFDKKHAADQIYHHDNIRQCVLQNERLADHIHKGKNHCSGLVYCTMPVLHLTTFIEAPAQLVFNLSRSVDLHLASMTASGEKAIACVTHGLLGKDDTVTWQARHLLKVRTLQTVITEMSPHSFFKDEMVEGDFKKLVHEHHFKEVANGTIMIDIFTTLWFIG